MQPQEEKWVWFDLDDTLHDFSSAASKAINAVQQKLAERTKISLDEININYRAILKKHNLLSFADGRTSREYRTERFMGALGEAANSEVAKALIEEVLIDYETIYTNNLKLKHGANDILQWLRDKDYALAILTEAPEDAQSRVIEKLNIGKFFRNIFTSGKLMVSKKNGMYQKVLQQTEANPSNIIMIGDTIEKDIEPAMAAGIKAIWFNEKQTPNENGYKTISSLPQLQAFFSQSY